MNLKNLEVPDILPAIAGKSNKILSAQIPTGKLGRLGDLISQTKCVQLVSEFARMDAKDGLSLISKRTYKLVREQIAIRPRARLATFTLLALALSLFFVNKGVGELQAKKAEIKVNGQLILV